MIAGKEYQVTFDLDNSYTTIGIWGPIALKTTTGGGKGNDIDINPTFGMYAIGGDGVVATPLTITISEENVESQFGKTRVVDFSVSNIGETALIAPWKMKINIDNGYSFSGNC